MIDLRADVFDVSGELIHGQQTIHKLNVKRICVHINHHHIFKVNFEDEITMYLNNHL